MQYTDLHIHTFYSDGENTPEEMVKSAIEKGVKKLGFSDHSYTSFDERYCIKKDNYDKYKAEINYLKKKYSGEIEILCGIEQDYYSDFSADGFDFVIGSVHYIKCENEYIAIDDDANILVSAAQKYFNGDIYSLAEEYFKTVADVVNKTGANIIGHFDLISKFCEQSDYLDTSNERYKKAWKKSADSLILTKAKFEINTGAISRGYRTSPYPSGEIIEYIKEKGGSFILSSDAHSHKNICYKFDEFKDLQVF